jgi:phosphatidylserine synthase
VNASFYFCGWWLLHSFSMMTNISVLELCSLQFRITQRMLLCFNTVELIFFLFATASRPTLGPTQPPIQWVPATLSQR